MFFVSFFARFQISICEPQSIWCKSILYWVDIYLNFRSGSSLVGSILSAKSTSTYFYEPYRHKCGSFYSVKVISASYKQARVLSLYRNENDYSPNQGIGLTLNFCATFIDLTCIKMTISLLIATMAEFSKWYKL